MSYGSRKVKWEHRRTTKHYDKINKYFVYKKLKYYFFIKKIKRKRENYKYIKKG